MPDTEQFVHPERKQKRNNPQSALDIIIRTYYHSDQIADSRGDIFVLHLLDESDNGTGRSGTDYDVCTCERKCS
jgi:hypothetical protein